MKEKNKLKWYDNGSIITTLVITTILVIIVCSQSFAVVGKSSLEIFSSIINHNSIYLLVLIYFILLKFKVGKRYFNYLNLFLVFIYFIITITSFLTVIQSFSINTLLSFLLYVTVLIYLFHTMFRDTRVWKEFKLGNSPFNEINNDTYYGIMAFLLGVMLVVNLISTVVISGVIIAFLDCIFYLLFGRYIYLYRSYLDDKKKDINNKGNFDELRDLAKEAIDNIKDKTELDEKFIELKDKANDYIKEKKIDEKIDVVKDKIGDTVEDIKDKIDDTVGDIKTKKTSKTKKKGVEK